MDKKIKWHRREILGGLLTVGVGLPILSLSPLFINSKTQHRFIKAKELLVLDGLLKGWGKDWPSLSQNPLEKDLADGLDEVLKVVRSDKRSDFLMALKLLTYGPSCYFLTGYFSPWKKPRDVQKVLERWASTENPVEGAIFHALSSLVGAAYYCHPNAGKGIGYPGPPEIDRGAN